MAKCVNAVKNDCKEREGMNRAIITGHLCKDPQQRTTQNGISVTSFTVAVQRKYKQDGQQQADFLNVVCWRGLAENVAKYCAKGSKVGVVGSIQTRSYEDANGARRYVTEIIADEVEFLSSKGEQEAQGMDDTFNELSDFQPLDDAELPF